MASDNHTMHKISSFSMVSPPDEVDLGGNITLKCIVCCSPPTDLTGEILLIKNQENVVIKSIELAEFTDGVNETSQFMVNAPVSLGEHTWSVVCPAREEDGAWHGEEISKISFTVKPHRTNLIIWDVPSVIGSGETFNVKLGVKCSSGCQPTGWSFCVHNQDGIEQTNVLVGNDLYVGTDSLYYATCELKSPEETGLYNWGAKIKFEDSDNAHEESIANFRVRVLPEPDCLLTVIAVNIGTQVPIQGVQILAHPYRAFTNENGVAEVRIPKGAYELFVSGKNYFPFRSSNEVTKNLTIRAELVFDEGVSDSDVWS